MRRRLLWWIPLLLLLVLGGILGRTLWIAGVLRSIDPHFDGTCKLVPGVVGPEDVTIHPRTGVAYVSSSDRRANAAGRPVPGAIYAYDLNAPEAQPVNLTPEADVSFQPHGISLFVGDDRDVLFVINHPPAFTRQPANTVEIFDVTPERLIHRATLSDPLLVMANDLVAVGVDRFYLTNTHRHPPGFLQTVETYLRLSGGRVVYYGRGGFRPALEGLVFPNGINVSADGRVLYIASVTGRSVLVYERDPKTERLSPRDPIYLGSGPDNIEVDAEGNLWIGAHAKMLRVGAHQKDPNELAPSQVLRVAPDGTVREIYLNRGEQVSAASVGAVRDRRLLIGQIFDDGLLDCTMNAPGTLQGR